MDKLFVDSDIILDLLTQREPFYVYAARLFSLPNNGQVQLYTSALCLSNINYLLSKQYNQASAKAILIRFKALVQLLPVDNKIIDLALNSPITDFEDAIQYFVATENKIPTLITRNLKDYKKAEIPVMTAEMYLKTRIIT